MTEDAGSGWIGYAGAEHGRPAADRNDHLSSEQRADLQRRADELAQARGHHQAVVVIDVYENGEAVPQVQFPKGSTIELTDQAQVNDCVAKATEALRNWR
ncbi:MAG: hypothetical protein ACRDZN_00530 [Acidimicrobiales bacterium]